MVSFGEPRFLWLTMLPAAAAMVALFRHRQRLQQQRLLASPAVWDRLMGGAPATGVLRLVGWCVAASLVALALARPQWGEMPAEESVRTRDLVVAVDVSDSMLCPDLRPSRLERSLDLIRRVLPALDGNRLGVVVFAGDAYPLVPLTTDLQAAASFLDAVTPRMVALPGSNLERAVAASLELLPTEGEGRVVVLITDGENLQGDMEHAATALHEAGAGVLAVLAGTEKGGPIPEPSEDGSIHYKRDANQQPVVTRAHREVLAALTDALDGEVIELAEPDAPRALIAAVDAIRTREVEATRQVRLVDRFPLFLGVAALFLVASFGLSPWRRRAVVAAVAAMLAALPAIAQQPPAAAPQGAGLPAASRPAPTDEAAASTAASEAPTPSWWQRWIPGGSRRLARRGVAAWQAGDLEAAARSFVEAAELEPDNPERLFDLGTALAAGGQLQPAVGVLDQAHRLGAPDAAYNAGTAALGGGQADAAVQYLREALLQAPDDPDAKRNYELALQLLQQQKEQQQQQDQDQQEKQDDQKEQEKQQNQDGEPTPTPTPSPSGGENQPQPTPTPDLSNQIFAALERAEEEARENMRTPTPQAVSVEKDW